MPSDMEFVPEPPSFVSDDESIRIAEGDDVRLRIMGVTFNAFELVRFSF